MNSENFKILHGIKNPLQKTGLNTGFFIYIDTWVHLLHNAQNLKQSKL